ncbi:MAG: glycosyltransferase [Spirochaetaceae bacterium]|nr:glycosyltransferase [Spirochaetaceae bacterium]
MKKNNTHAVSVIIPVYNTELYLRECLDSVVNQTLKDIEIICVNDGSTDGSLSILQEYKNNDSRVIILSQENNGAGSARNAGLDIAKGEYLSILDSDDIYDVTMLEKMHNHSDKLQTDFTVCLSKAFDNITKTTWDINWSGIDIQEDIFSYKDILNTSHAFDFFIGWSWDKLFRKSFIDKHGLRFQEINNSNDAFFVFSTMYIAERITILREYLVKHRINREGSIELTHDINPYCFYEMHKAVKDNLIRFNIFPEVKELFAIWSLKHSLWVLSIIKIPKSFIEIYSIIQNKCFPENSICNLSIEKFDEKWLYDEMQKINEQVVGEYLFNQRNTARSERDHLQIERDQLQVERDRLQIKCDQLQVERDRLQIKCDQLQVERDRLQVERDQLQNEKDTLITSLSFRLGRVLTWFPRKIRGFFRFLKKRKCL